MLNLSARKLELELPAESGATNVLLLEHITDATGTVEQTDDHTHLRPVSAKQLMLSGMEWALPNGRVVFAKPAILGLIEIDADLHANPGDAFPIDGELSVGSMQSENVSVEIGGRRIGFDATVERISLEHAPADGLHIDMGRGTARNIQTAVAGWLVRVGELAMETARVQGDRFEAASVTLDTVGLHDANHEIAAAKIDLPAGIVVRPDSITMRELRIGELKLTVHDVKDDGKAQGDSDGAGETHPLLDLRALDLLQGKLDVDLTADFTVPVLGRRKATHHFRIPIDHGTINYRELERDLASLEDSVIDIAVRGTNLELERRVPLIPGTNKPILVWPLNEVELGLAKRRLVRLRTLPNLRVPDEVKKADDRASGGSSVALRRLDFDDIVAQLSLPARETPDGAEPMRPLASAIVRPAIGNLTVRGDVRHDPRVELAPTGLVMQATALSAGLVELPVGEVKLSAEKIDIGAVEDATLSFEGPRPRTLVATLRDVHMYDVALRFEPPAAPETDDAPEDT